MGRSAELDRRVVRNSCAALNMLVRVLLLLEVDSEESSDDEGNREGKSDGLCHKGKKKAKPHHARAISKIRVDDETKAWARKVLTAATIAITDDGGRHSTTSSP